MSKGTKGHRFFPELSLNAIFVGYATIVSIVAATVILLAFMGTYKNAMEQNAVISVEQSVAQVDTTVLNYTEDMESVMELIRNNINNGESREIFFQELLTVRTDVAAVMIYDMDGNLIDCWAGEEKLKENYSTNLSYVKDLPVSERRAGEDLLNITEPHVESIFQEHYPWVVTISQYMENAEGERIQLAVDIRFDNIADYIDNVGIGQYGYCYIADRNGEIIYHPQQQLIYSGVKEENHISEEDGSYIDSDAIYTIKSLKNCNWRIVGVSYVDEMITARLEQMVKNLLLILSGVLLCTVVAGIFLSKMFSGSVKQLTLAMRDFEDNTDDFSFQPVRGTKEINFLSESFGHMATKIQQLMETIRQEEVALRKTELKALQAQINPHFLYNTLDAIAWMCEAGRNEEAEEMVNALARLFRISISKGHELITIEKEIEHAKSYLKIQNFRYKNQFSYRFDVDEECLQYYCNKITLQPIIENAIYHGLDRMVDEGMIRISIFQEEDAICFEVEDNGVGMTQEQCKEILHEEPDTRAGIGIKNVNDRIRINFGDEYGLSICSELDEGTCVRIRIPKVMENTYENAQ